MRIGGNMLKKIARKKCIHVMLVYTGGC